MINAFPEIAALPECPLNPPGAGLKPLPGTARDVPPPCQRAAPSGLYRKERGAAVAMRAIAKIS